MKVQSIICALFALALLVGHAQTQPRLGTPQDLVIVEQQPKQPDKEKKPDKDKKPDPEKKPVTPPPDLFTQSALMGPQFATGFNPHMMGDFAGTFVRRTFTVMGEITTTTTTTVRDTETGTVTTTTTTTKTPTTQTRTILVPAGGTLGSIKIADNSSPAPVDRVFFTYNFFQNLGGFANPAAGATTASIQSSQSPNFFTQTSVNQSTAFPGSPPGGFDLHREVFGFEKTLLDGNASIEFRLPVLQQNSAIDGFSGRNVGDITIVTKYAFLLDRDTGNVVSGGLGITVPTGPGTQIFDDTLHTTWLQPWFGYIWNSDRFFINAFHSVVVPTDAREVTVLFNDVGLNFWLYRANAERPLRFVVPMAEVHVTTPLNHRDPSGDVFCPDLVVITAGAHFGLFRNGTLSLGVATPVTGPRVYNVEAFVQVNWRY